ncbi:MAG: molybdopterin-synthase adenylyltransferase MoeB [Planctomycetota bacterium]|jgi:adenylyltransferase/sulfurtransferase|nr:molybdopterin-synthase adenylyltransferase MoeB [Planctomycetota bacterium]MDP7253312.1 molybdopterin-synthase adenylyltransferase MoeB [Planctomycetota bacterium]
MGNLSNEEIFRYSRHLIMPEVGLEGQQKLKDASVLCVGTGGLGSPLLLYLAAAGVGKLGIMDFDVVDNTNLQRQVIHGTKDVGRPKLDSAKETILDINPFAEVELYETRLTSDNALEILRDYDVIADGTDNFPTRYLVNDACVLLGKPNVYGSIFRFEGQASVFDATRGPNYRDLYPEPPPPGMVPSCAEGGVFGVLPGIIGVIQATEAIKLITGIGEPLIGRLMIYDALAMSFTELKLRKDPNAPEIKELIDYEHFCGMEELPVIESIADVQLTVEDLKTKIDNNEDMLLVDVREPHEWEICHIDGARLVPLSQFTNEINQLNSAQEIVLLCHKGIRSLKALQFLHQAGFRKLKNLQGGIDAWASRIEPDMPRYA